MRMEPATLRDWRARTEVCAVPAVRRICGEKAMTDDQKEAFEERAAIIQYCTGAGMTRSEAEQIASEQMGLSDDEIEFVQGTDYGQ
jgi:hypothetical protein